MFKLVVIRHAIAEDRTIFAELGKKDELRPLTLRGRKKFRKAMSAIKNYVGDLQLIAASPLKRAVETVDIMQSFYPKIKTLKTEVLRPEAELFTGLSWLTHLKKIDSVAIVGHEPHLSRLVSFLLTGREAPIVSLKKGSVAILNFAGKIAPGAAKLQCLLQPNQLRDK